VRCSTRCETYAVNTNCGQDEREQGETPDSHLYAQPCPIEHCSNAAHTVLSSQLPSIKSSKEKRDNRMKVTRIVVVLFVLTAVLFSLTACGNGGGSALNPKFQPQVANLADNFQFQSTAVTNVTETLTYKWTNSGIAATVDQATSVTTGQAVIAIKDAAGVQVYSAGLQNNGTFDTATGQTGSWTIIVQLTNYSGTINFRVQKK
jgi:hypothetical protein